MINVPKMIPSVEYANGIDNKPAPIMVLTKLIDEETVDALASLSIEGISYILLKVVVEKEYKCQ